jgi:hypothetical protein
LSAGFDAQGSTPKVLHSGFVAQEKRRALLPKDAPFSHALIEPA